MMNFLISLIVIQVITILFSRTLIGKILIMSVKTILKVISTVLVMDYKGICKVYKFVSKKHSQMKVQKLKKVVNGSNVIKLGNYRSSNVKKK